MIEPIEIDSDQLRSNFEVRPVRVKHGLEHNPLFQLDALLGAANRLPLALIECNAGDVPVGLPEGKSAVGLMYQKAFSRRNPSWLRPLIHRA